MKMFLALSALFFMANVAQANSLACDIEQTKAGDYGVRELRASGWVYIVRGLTYAEAEKAYWNLVTQGRCEE